jgi:hypothetical protein
MGLTSEAVGSLDLALVALAQDHAHHPLLGVLGDPVVVVDDRQQHKRVYHQLLRHRRRHREVARGGQPAVAESGIER